MGTKFIDIMRLYQHLKETTNRKKSISDGSSTI